MSAFTFDAVRLAGLDIIDLPITRLTPADPFQVNNVSGLGPPELDNSIVEDQDPGGQYLGRTAQAKEIVVLVGLNPDRSTGETIADLRFKLYGLLSPSVNPLKQGVIISLLRNGVPVVEIEGYVKRLEIVPFSKSPQVQITFACLSPYFRDVADTELDPVPSSTTWEIENEGRAPTGLYFRLKFLAGVSSFTLAVQNNATMEFVSEFLIGDELEVNTNPANRFVGLWRTDEWIKKLGILTPESEWAVLHGGTNTISVSNPSDIQWMFFKYRTQYWGV